MHKTGVFDKIISEEDADYKAAVTLQNVLGESEQIQHELCKLKTLQGCFEDNKNEDSELQLCALNAVRKALGEDAKLSTFLTLACTSIIKEDDLDAAHAHEFVSLVLASCKRDNLSVAPSFESKMHEFCNTCTTLHIALRLPIVHEQHNSSFGALVYGLSFEQPRTDDIRYCRKGAKRYQSSSRLCKRHGI